MSVTVAGARKFVPSTVIVAGVPVAGKRLPSWLRLFGDALDAVGGSLWYENGTETADWACT